MFSYRRFGDRDEVIGILNIEFLFIIIFPVPSTYNVSESAWVSCPYSAAWKLKFPGVQVAMFTLR